MTELYNDPFFGDYSLEPGQDIGWSSQDNPGNRMGKAPWNVLKAPAWMSQLYEGAGIQPGQDISDWARWYQQNKLAEELPWIYNRKWSAHDLYMADKMSGYWGTTKEEQPKISPPSMQTWNQLTPSERESLAGWMEWTGIPWNDFLNMVQGLWSQGTSAGETQYLPAYQR